MPSPGAPAAADAAQATHALAMESAFERAQAAACLQWDLWAGVSLSVLLLLALPSSLQRSHWRSQVAAFIAEVAARLLPAGLVSKR